MTVMNTAKALRALTGLILVALYALTANASPATDIGFIVIGDTGYIPAYDPPDDDEPAARTLDEYLAREAAAWRKRNATLDGWQVTPWTFEATWGGYVAASGLYPVARAASETCQRRRCDFAVMLGDNIYPDGATLGSDGISDARRFADMLDRPYGRFGTGTPGFTIYAMLGNHDWHHSREGAEAQWRYLDQHPNFTMPGLFYRTQPEQHAGQVELFVIDTQILLAGESVPADKLDDDGNEIATGKLESFDAHMQPRTAAERDMVAWLEQSLAASTAKWKIVLGHHPLWSGGGSKHEKARVLRRLLLPALCRHADAYFSGDDHVLEAYTDSCAGMGIANPRPLPLIVSGAGSKQRALHARFRARQLEANPQITNPFSKGSTWGYVHVAISGDTLRTVFYSTPNDMTGRPVEEAVLEFQHRSAQVKGSSRRSRSPADR
jgi:hypothetical protein